MISYDRLRYLVDSKLVTRTLPDSFEDISEEIFGEGNAYSSSEVRRRMYGMKRLFEVIDNEGLLIHKVNAKDPLYNQTKRIEHERKALLDQQRVLDAKLSHAGRLEALGDRLFEAALTLTPKLHNLYQEELHTIRGNNEAVLVLADWHYGMKTYNVWNEYSTDICVNRVRKLIDGTVERMKLHKPSKLHILVLGDMISGAIHTTSRIESEQLVCDQIMQVSELIAETVAELSQYVPELNLYCTYGNHSRTVQSKKDSIHTDNIERLIPWWLELRLAGFNHVHIINSEYPEFATMNVCGYHICATHGDLEKKVNTAGKSLYALFSQRFDQKIDYIILAHRHHLEEFEELAIETISVRALCGTDNFANTKRLYSIPGQTLLFFNPECGRDASYNIRLD